MVYVQGINSLNGYNCTAFDDGCPDMFYLSDESYKCKLRFLSSLVTQNIYVLECIHVYTYVG